MEELFDIAIIGAGPAGSVAAYAAARRGMRVALIDRQTFPRDKPCGDGIGPGAVDIAQQLGLGDIFKDAVPVEAVRIIGPDGIDLKSAIPRVHGRKIQGYVVPRVDFDKRIFERAVKEGAHDLSGNKFIGTVDAGNHRVVTIQDNNRNQRRIGAKLLVGADGANSVVRRALGVAESAPQHTGIAIRAYTETRAFDASALEGPQLLFVFSRELLPSYAWLFPTGAGIVNLGVGGPLVEIQKRGRSLKDMLNSFANEIRAMGYPLGELHGQRAHHLPHFGGLPKLAHPHAVIIGDAASMINPVSGEGIAYGMTAAARLIEGLPDTITGGTVDSSLLKFERDFRRTYRLHIASSIGVHKLMRSPYWATTSLRAAQRDPAVLRDAVEMLFGFGRVNFGTSLRILRTGLTRP